MTMDNIVSFPGKISRPDMQEEEAPAKLDRRSRDRVHDRANMQTFLFRSYDLIVKSDEADLVRDVGFDIDKAQTKLS